jgi:hypothetical protein
MGVAAGVFGAILAALVVQSAQRYCLHVGARFRFAGNVVWTCLRFNTVLQPAHNAAQTGYFGKPLFFGFIWIPAFHINPSSLNWINSRFFAASRHERQYGWLGMSGSTTGQNATA